MGAPKILHLGSLEVETLNLLWLYKVILKCPTHFFLVAPCPVCFKFEYIHSAQECSIWVALTQKNASWFT